MGNVLKFGKVRIIPENITSYEPEGSDKILLHLVSGNCRYISFASRASRDLGLLQMDSHHE